MHWFWLMDLGSLIGLMKARNSILLIAVALVVATVVVYLPVGHHEFVNFDDDQFVTENPNLPGRPDMAVSALGVYGGFEARRSVF